MTISPADSTMVAIRKKIRRLTASAGESSLKTADIDQYVNTYYSQDFPYSIKLDQMRSIYTFFTEPYRDRYPLDVNYNQGVRAPVYFEGIQGNFTKDRQQFNTLWPRFPTKFQNTPNVDVNGTIVNIILSNPITMIASTVGLSNGDQIIIENVQGTTELNGNTYTVGSVNHLINVFVLVGINGTVGFSPYVYRTGTWSFFAQQEIFYNVPGPFLTHEVVIGGTDQNGNPISINDNGYGVLQLMQPNPVTSVPAQNTNPALPGMYNVNLNNPGLNNPTDIGTVNYVTGDIEFTLPLGIFVESGTQITTWVSQYQTGRPYSLLFWNNEFVVRPVPKLIHKVEIETYLTPVQFLETTDSPILQQWWQLIAIGAAIKVLEDRQDMDGVQNLSVLFDRQEALVLERQGIEEIFQPTPTMFNSVSGVPIGPWGNWGSW